jgi:hypothetical protein
MIKLTITGSQIPSPAVLSYLDEEYARGTLSHHRDGNTYIFAFYNPEDEAAFILKFGNSFYDNVSSGHYFCPYIPAGLK